METVNITVKTCEDLVCQKLGLKSCSVIGYTMEPLSEYKCGFMGEHWILKVKIEESIDVLRFFIKSEPLMEATKAYSKATRVFLKEGNFYHKIVPEFRKFDIREIEDVVSVSYEHSNPNVLILEDLSSEGYKMLDARHCLPLDVVKASLITFAKFHASSLLYEEKMTEKIGKLYRISDHFQAELNESFYCQTQLSVALVESTAKGIPTQIDIFSELNIKEIDKFKSFVVKIWKNVLQYAKPSTKFRNVICQGDPWITNLMFKIETNQPIKCKLIDYQMNRYSPPAQDVITFLYLCTNKEFRNDHLKDCLKLYYAYLIEILKKHNLQQDILPEAEFWESVEYYQPFAMAQNLSHSHMTKLSPMSIKVVFDNPLIMRKFVFEDKSETLIDLCKKNGFYREKQKENILDFIELYEKSYKRILDLF